MCPCQNLRACVLAFRSVINKSNSLFYIVDIRTKTTEKKEQYRGYRQSQGDSKVVYIVFVFHTFPSRVFKETTKGRT